jgi:hypothetical protein
VPLLSLPFEKSAEILRSLVAVQAAATVPGPLPFKLTCHDDRSRVGDRCGSDPRGVLASIPLAEVFRIDRSHFPATFVFQIGDPTGYDDDMPFWEIELKEMGTRQAEVRMAWTVRTLE